MNHSGPLTIAIESIGFGGAGVGRLPDGRACFVPFTLPGERAEIRVVREKKSFAEAEVVRLAEASVDRVAARCPVFGRCGGCAYQHVRYERQLAIKTGQVRELLRRIAGQADPDVRPMLASPQEWAYRNRIGVHTERGRVGFFGRKSRRIVPVAGCPIASPGVNAQLAALAADPPCDDRKITLREDAGFRGFSQVNPGAAGILAGVVAGMLADGGGHLVDAYCGAGFLSARPGDRFRALTGIEWSAGAVRAARADARPDDRFLEGAVEVHLPDALAAAAPAETALIVDPPAEGLSREVVDALLANPPATLAYVSCDPPTLARDVKALAGKFRLEFAQPVDMFPQTAEIEVAALLKIL
jgi:23S rRNA (uracil1939-C5)-methyltransferase